MATTPILDVLGNDTLRHEHLGLHALTDDAVQKTQVAVLPVVVLAGGICAVAEVVRLVDDNEVVVSPVDALDGKPAAGVAVLAREIGMVEHVIAQTVLRDGVVDEVAAEGHPVVRKLLGTEHQHVAVPGLVVLDDGKRRERLAEAHAVGEDATVVGLELVDDRYRGIPLEVVELAPDGRLLETGTLVGEHVL